MNQPLKDRLNDHVSDAYMNQFGAGNPNVTPPTPPTLIDPAQAAANGLAYVTREEVSRQEGTAGKLARKIRSRAVETAKVLGEHGQGRDPFWVLSVHKASEPIKTPPEPGDPTMDSYSGVLLSPAGTLHPYHYSQNSEQKAHFYIGLDKKLRSRKAGKGLDYGQEATPRELVNMTGINPIANPDAVVETWEDLLFSAAASALQPDPLNPNQTRLNRRLHGERRQGPRRAEDKIKYERREKTGEDSRFLRKKRTRRYLDQNPVRRLVHRRKTKRRDSEAAYLRKDRPRNSVDAHVSALVPPESEWTS